MLTVSTTELPRDGGSWTLIGGVMLSDPPVLAGMVTGNVIVSPPEPKMKLPTSTLTMRCPSPHASATPAATASASPSLVLFMARLLIDRQRGRHHDPAFARKVLTRRGEADIEPQRPEAHAAAPAELDLLAPVARHTAAQRQRPELLLRADMDGRAAARVEDVHAERDVARVVRDVADVGHRKLALALRHRVEHRLHELVARGIVGGAVDLGLRPRQRGADVVDAEAELDRPLDHDHADVAAHAGTELLARVVREAVQHGALGRHGDAVAEDRGAGAETGHAAALAVRDAEVAMDVAAEVEAVVRIRPGDLTGPADRRREAGLRAAGGQQVVRRAVVGLVAVAQECAQAVAQVDADVFLEEREDAEPHALDVEA